MSNGPITDKAVIKSMVEGFSPWYHQIKFPGNITSPGMNNSDEMLSHLDMLGLPRNAKGMRVLDIGCRDGYFMFEMERRGAEVIGIDYALPTTTGFSIASKILDSKTTFRVENVYDLAPEKLGLFDLVLFLGVLYHLRHPLLALDKIRTVIKPGALMFVETHLIDNYFQLKDGSFVSMGNLSMQLTETPIMQFYARDRLAGDATNKFAPNMAALRAMTEEAEFEILGDYIYGTRGYVKARAIEDDRLGRFRQMDGTTEGNRN
ncbi:MAG: methyltransferase domain-containing protein [Chloroflexi bacterium]|nr:methyltransferase domain-containing protein [Chloroflexota bacterium]